jgi:hypothetical protein
MSVIFWVCAPLALLGAGVLLVLRPWIDRGKARRRLWRAARIQGFHEACHVPENEAAQFQDIAREYPDLGRRPA